MIFWVAVLRGLAGLAVIGLLIWLAHVFTDSERSDLRALGKIYGWPWWWSTARRRRRLAEIRTGGARPKLAQACAKLLRGADPSPAAIRRMAAERLGLPRDQVRVTRPDDAGLCVAVFGASHDRREQLRIELQEIVPIGIRIEVVDDQEGW